MNLSEDITKKKIFSQLAYVAASILFAFVTDQFVSIYSIAHWKIAFPTISLDYNTKKFIALKQKTPCPQTKEMETTINDMKFNTEQLRDISWTLMKKSGLYPLTGIASFLFSVLSLREKPRWIGFISLPFGIWGLIMSMFMT